MCEVILEFEEPNEEPKDEGCVPLLLFVRRRSRSRRQTNSLDLRTGAPDEVVFCLPSVLLLPGAPAGSFSAILLGTERLQLAQVSPCARP